jgi:hypothetical protein
MTTDRHSTNGFSPNSGVYDYQPFSQENIDQFLQADPPPSNTPPEPAPQAPLAVDQPEPAPLTQPPGPDPWSYAFVGVAGGFYLLNLVSPFLALQVLLSTSGLAGVVLPLGPVTLSLVDTVSVMATGMGEGVSLGDAYLSYKQPPQGFRKGLFKLLRGTGFVAQAVIFYAALSQVFWTGGSVTQLGFEGFEGLRPEQPIKTVLIQEAPSLTDGLAVGALSVTWSGACSFLIPEMLLLAILSLRRKQQRQKPGLILDQLLHQLRQQMEVEVQARQMSQAAALLQTLQQSFDPNLGDVLQNADLRNDMLHLLATLPDDVFQQANMTRAEFETWLQGAAKP